MAHVDSEMIELVKMNALISDYFYEIVVPEVPDYYSEYPVDFSYKQFANCPLHGEETPSLKWFEYSNSYYCFGCNSGGDVIKFHMEFMLKCKGIEVSFYDAVMFLYQRFVEGKKDTELIKGKKRDINTLEPDKISTVTELIIFKRYITQLDKNIAKDEYAKVSDKNAVYEAIDTMHLLVSLNEINALEAKKFIQKSVKKHLVDTRKKAS